MLQDRVRTTSTSTGTGNLTLLDPDFGYQSFEDGRWFYVIEFDDHWEVGYCNISGSTLARNKVLSSTNDNDLVDFGSGTKKVFLSAPAEFLKRVTRKLDNVKVVSVDNISLSGTPVIDGVATVSGDRVLLVGQNDDVENGVWIVDDDYETWDRPSDYASGDHAFGTIVFVNFGNDYIDSGWIVHDDFDTIVDSNGTTWVQISGSRDFWNLTETESTNFDLAETSFYQYVLTDNTTFSVSNVRIGQRFLIRVIQQGGHSITWWPSVRWEGDNQPAQSADSVTMFGFVKVGDNDYDGFVLGRFT